MLKNLYKLPIPKLLRNGIRREMEHFSPVFLSVAQTIKLGGCVRNAAMSGKRPSDIELMGRGVLPATDKKRRPTILYQRKFINIQKMDRL